MDISITTHTDNWAHFYTPVPSFDDGPKAGELEISPPPDPIWGDRVYVQGWVTEVHRSKKRQTLMLFEDYSWDLEIGIDCEITMEDYIVNNLVFKDGLRKDYVRAYGVCAGYNIDDGLLLILATRYYVNDEPFFYSFNGMDASFFERDDYDPTDFEIKRRTYREISW